LEHGGIAADRFELRDPIGVFGVTGTERTESRGNGLVFDVPELAAPVCRHVAGDIQDRRRVASVMPAAHADRLRERIGTIERRIVAARAADVPINRPPRIEEQRLAECNACRIERAIAAAEVGRQLGKQRTGILKQQPVRVLRRQGGGRDGNHRSCTDRMYHTERHVDLPGWRGALRFLCDDEWLGLVAPAVNHHDFGHGIRALIAGRVKHVAGNHACVAAIDGRERLSVDLDGQSAFEAENTSCAPGWACQGAAAPGGNSTIVTTVSSTFWPWPSRSLRRI
jgi:hypothetical protein